MHKQPAKWPMLQHRTKLLKRILHYIAAGNQAMLADRHVLQQHHLLQAQ
jgi:hypothetical protein